MNRGQLPHFHPTAALLDLHLQVGKDLAGDLREIDRHEVRRTPRDAREHEQVVDKRLHARGRVAHALDAVAARRVQPLLALQFQAVAKGENLAQGLLQVVRCDIGELFQIAVRPLQLGGVAGLPLLGLLTQADVADKKGQDRRARLLADGHGHFRGKSLDRPRGPPSPRPACPTSTLRRPRGNDRCGCSRRR